MGGDTTNFGDNWVSIVQKNILIPQKLVNGGMFFCSWTQRTRSTILTDLECFGRYDTYGRPELFLSSTVIITGHRSFCGTGMGRPVFYIVERVWRRGVLSQLLRTVSAYFHLSRISNGRYLTSHSPGMLTIPEL